MLLISAAVLSRGIPDLVQMLFANPPGQPTARIQTRPSDPPHRVLLPDPFLQQMLTHESHLAGHARNCGLRMKPSPTSDVIHEHLPIDFLQVRLRSPPLQPATPTIQLVPQTGDRCLTQPPELTLPDISFHHPIPSLHTLLPFIRFMLRDEPFRPQVHFAIQYDARYDVPAGEKTSSGNKYNRQITTVDYLLAYFIQF